MGEKLLNIIDESGQIIGVDTRENIHAKGLLHKEVNVWFVDPKNRIIFQRRSASKDTFPNLLDATAGGHVEIGSDYLQTAIKETYEETGVKIWPDDLILLDMMNVTFEDKISKKINRTQRAVYQYKFNGEINSLKKEIGAGEGFEAYSCEELSNLSEQESKRFIPGVIDKRYLEIFKKMGSN